MSTNVEINVPNSSGTFETYHPKTSVSNLSEFSNGILNIDRLKTNDIRIETDQNGNTEPIRYCDKKLDITEIPNNTTYNGLVILKDKNEKYTSTLQNCTDVDGSVSTYITARRYKNDNYIIASLGVQTNDDGTTESWAPEPPNKDNSGKIATTKYVKENANNLISSAMTLYVSKTGTGDGSTLDKAMSLDDLNWWLSSVKMQPGANSLNSSSGLTIKFVPIVGQSYGTVSFDTNKMPGVRHLYISSASTTAPTLSNYATTAPIFDNLYINGYINTVIENVEVVNKIEAEFNAYVQLRNYVGFAQVSARRYGYINFLAGTFNIHSSSSVSIPFYAYNKAMMDFNTNLINFNFRDQYTCSNAIFYFSNNVKSYINFNCIKWTGIKPITILSSGTSQGTSQTAGNTVAKTVTLDNNAAFTLQTGAVVYMRFANANTASNITLNVNGTGAKSIYYKQNPIQSNLIVPNVTYAFVYDGEKYICDNWLNTVFWIDGMSTFTRNGIWTSNYNTSDWCFDDFIYRASECTCNSGALMSRTGGASSYGQGLLCHHNWLRKGINYPSGSLGIQMAGVFDNNPDTSRGDLGSVRVEINNNGNVMTSLYAYEYNDNTRVAHTLGVVSQQDGESYGYAPSPWSWKYKDNKIATTAWCYNLLTAQGLSTSFTSKNFAYRAYDITEYYQSGEMSTDIANNNFNNVIIGDYFNVSITLPATTGYTQKTYNVRWRVADLNPFWKSGTGTLHIMLISETVIEQGINMGSPANGFVNSKFWTEEIPRLNTAIKNAFGADHVLTHKETLSTACSNSIINAVGQTGGPSAYSDFDVTVNIPTETMLFGQALVGVSPFNAKNHRGQLPFYASGNVDIWQGNTWLSSIASTTDFVLQWGGRVDHSGTAASNIGIRPYFLFY